MCDIPFYRNSSYITSIFSKNKQSSKGIAGMMYEKHIYVSQAWSTKEFMVLGCKCVRSCAIKASTGRHRVCVALFGYCFASKVAS